MIGTLSGRESGKSMLAACHNDDDDNICNLFTTELYIHTFSRIVFFKRIFKKISEFLMPN